MNEWISVKDRLPIDRFNVLVYIPSYSEQFHDSCITIATLDKGNNFNFYDENYLGYNDNITHWMPLPEPPQKGILSNICL